MTAATIYPCRRVAVTSEWVQWHISWHVRPRFGWQAAWSGAWSADAIAVLKLVSPRDLKASQGEQSASSVRID